MAQTQFISHIQVTPPPAVSSRRGSGAFSAAILVISILIGAATGGVVLWERQLITQADDAQKRLVQLKDEFGVDSIKQAQKLQQRITIAQQLLNGHSYGSQLVNFVEENTLSGVILTDFEFNDQKLETTLEASGYLQFAQQIQHYRSLVPTKLSEIKFNDPTLKEDGRVKFKTTLVLSPAYIRERPTIFIDSSSFNDPEEDSFTGLLGSTPSLGGSSTSSSGSSVPKPPIR